MENELKPELVPDPEKDNGSAPAAPVQLWPVCPNCKENINIMARVFICLPFKFVLPFCTSCRFILDTILVDIAQPQNRVATPQRSSLIV